MCFLHPALKQRGLSLIETVLGCAVLVLVLSIVLPSINSFKQAVDNICGANAAYLLAGDVRRVQTIDMYRGREYYAINFDEVNNRYMLTRSNKVQEAYNIGELINDSWRIKAVNKQNIFYMRGSVNMYNYIDIYRPGAASKGYRIQILPVSGRTGVYKNEK